MTKANHLNKGQSERIMNIENKQGLISWADARIGWASSSKTNRTVYYRDKVFVNIFRHGLYGNYIHIDAGEEY
ncbi:hypothetical protein DM558_13545 [Entomomonas moraniae]|uniref:Uncharacterized protein n=2 Tax=Entomomonas moraniae TaxID=2213226 RepID=A0A3Q9JP21_9GAMM|nr:hypothetical protein DM558_13545 [Entomomonas moraniae]